MRITAQVLVEVGGPDYLYVEVIALSRSGRLSATSASVTSIVSKELAGTLIRP